MLGKQSGLWRAVSACLLAGSVIFDDLNPITLAWVFVKGRVRTCGPREDAPRQQAIEAAIAAIPDSLAPACFRHCQYLQPG